MSDAPERRAPTARRLLVTYAVLALLTAAVLVPTLVHGTSLKPSPDVSGTFATVAPGGCLGPAGTRLRLRQSGEFVDADTTGSVSAQLRLDGGAVTGDLRCEGGATVPVRLTVAAADGGARILEGSVGSESVSAPQVADATAVAAVKPRSSEETFGRLMLAIGVVILAARLLGTALRRLGQQQVIGEVLAGILLGPTLLGAIAPGALDYLFPRDIVPLLGAGADIGLAFFMFLVGLELDPAQLRGRVASAALISNSSVAVAMAAGVLTALPLYHLLGPSRDFVPFSLFVGVAMSITAFPVLARILVERRMLRRPVGGMALAAAAVDDVAAWSLLALATATAAGGSSLSVVRIVALAAVFCIGMGVLVRPLLGRVARVYDEVGSIPAPWVAAIFVGVLLSAFTAQSVGVAAIFGAFVMGLVMPRRSDLTREINGRLEDFIVTVLLPLFFAVVGLKTQVGLLNRPQLWLITLALIGVAVACKYAGSFVPARLTGLSTREAAVLATLMNTRGLTELIVLNIGLELGVVTPDLFAMLVVMALVTTFMAGPMLRLLDPRGMFSAPVEETVRAAETTATPAVAGRSTMLVASTEDRNLETLVALARPLAGQDPVHEVVLLRLVTPTRATAGLVGDNRELQRIGEELGVVSEPLRAAGLPVRTATFTSPRPGQDIVRLAAASSVDLVLIDGRRPLLGEGVPRGAVGDVLAQAVSDVAVVVARDGATFSGAVGAPIVVPFGGADNDWAALELAGRVAGSTGGVLRLLGSATGGEGDRDASRLLADAALLVQQFAGVHCEPVLIEAGQEGVLAAAADASLVVIGLSERWRQEGLGPVRASIARAVAAPAIFVRRGERPGALSGPAGGTRFAWSQVAPAPIRAVAGGADTAGS